MKSLHLEFKLLSLNLAGQPDCLHTIILFYIVNKYPIDQFSIELMEECW